jgi:hypothetical protein
MRDDPTKGNSVFRMCFEKRPNLRKRAADVMGFKRLNIRLEDSGKGGEKLTGRLTISGLDVGEEGNGFESESLGDLTLGQRKLAAPITDIIAERFGHVANYAKFANSSTKILLIVVSI